jgi:hypothetical protein
VKFSRTCWAMTLLALPAVAQGQGKAIESSKRPPVHVQASPAALQLARTLAVPRLSLLSRTTAAEMREHVKRQLLSSTLATRGPGCDPTTPECKAAADAIASAHAVEYAHAINEAIDRGQAQFLEAMMSPAQIRATLDFARTDAGQAFAGTLRMDPSTDRTLLTRILGTVKLPGAPLEEFYEATKHLPRASLPMAPPAPPPPPPYPRRAPRDR